MIKALVKPPLTTALRWALRVPLLGRGLEVLALGRGPRRSRLTRSYCYHVADQLGRIEPQGTRVVALPGGARLQVRLGDFTCRYLFEHGAYEPSSTAFLQSWLRPGDTFVDVGANVGYFTIIAGGMVGEQGQVHAFEPNPQVAELLASSVALNRFGTRVRLTKAALGEQDAASATLFLSPEPGNSGLASLRNLTWANPDQSLAVPVISLDTYAKAVGLGPIRLLKLDVEGFELQVLQGAKALFAQQPPEAILVEFNAFIDPALPPLLLDFLQSRDYVPFVPGSQHYLRPYPGLRGGQGNVCFIRRAR